MLYDDDDGVYIWYDSQRKRWTEAVLLSKIDKAIKCSKKCFLKEAIAWNLLFQAKRKKNTIFTTAVKCKKK